MPEHHRTRELQEFEHQKSVRALQETATAEIRDCSDKQAATELEMQNFQEELRTAQVLNAAQKAAFREAAPPGGGSTAAAGSSIPSSEKKITSSMPSPVPYEKDDSREIPPPWLHGAPDFGTMYETTTTTTQQPTYTFLCPPAGLQSRMVRRWFWPYGRKHPARS